MNPHTDYGFGERPLWQWAVFSLIIGGIIYAGVRFFFTSPITQQQASPPATPTPQVIQQSQSTVTLTENGFSPATLNIKAGTTVIWVNESGEIATVDSGPHPAHTGYSPLNLGSFQSGESFSLTFDKPGTYGYHNHLNPSKVGIITVE